MYQVLISVYEESKSKSCLKTILESTIGNVDIAFGAFLTVLVANSSAERSFSQMKYFFFKC